MCRRIIFRRGIRGRKRRRTNRTEKDEEDKVKESYVADNIKEIAQLLCSWKK